MGHSVTRSRLLKISQIAAQLPVLPQRGELRKDVIHDRSLQGSQLAVGEREQSHIPRRKLLSKVIDLFAVLRDPNPNPGPQRIDHVSQVDRRTLKHQLRLRQIAIHCQILTNQLLNSCRFSAHRGSVAVPVDMG